MGPDCTDLWAGFLGEEAGKGRRRAWQVFLHPGAHIFNSVQWASQQSGVLCFGFGVKSCLSIVVFKQWVDRHDVPEPSHRAYKLWGEGPTAKDLDWTRPKMGESVKWLQWPGPSCGTSVTNVSEDSTCSIADRGTRVRPVYGCGMYLATNVSIFQQ